MSKHTHEWRVSHIAKKNSYNAYYDEGEYAYLLCQCGTVKRVEVSYEK